MLGGKLDIHIDPKYGRIPIFLIHLLIGTPCVAFAVWLLSISKIMDNELLVYSSYLLFLAVPAVIYRSLVKMTKYSSKQKIEIQNTSITFHWNDGQKFKFLSKDDWKIEEESNYWVVLSLVNTSSKKIAKKAFPNLKARIYEFYEKTT